MINFKEELKKYEPVLEVKDLEQEITECHVKDMMEILTQLSGERGQGSNASKNNKDSKGL